MSLDPGRVETVTFDSFSTLVDPLSAVVALEGYVDDPEALARHWHPVAVQYATVANFLDAYATYDELHRDALEYLLARRDVEVSAAELDEINAVYHDLDPFDDVPDGLERLADAGYHLAVVSNGDPPMLESLADTAEIGEYVEEFVSADEIRTFKPAAELYEHAAERVDTPVDAIVHVSAGWGDVMGGMHAGTQGAWLNREDDRWPPFGPEPDLVADSIHDVADALGA